MSHPLWVVAHVGDVVENLLQGPIDLDAFFDTHGSASCAPNTFSAAMMPAHEVLRAGSTFYSPKCVEGVFSAVRRKQSVLTYLPPSLLCELAEGTTRSVEA